MAQRTFRALDGALFTIAVDGQPLSGSIVSNAAVTGAFGELSMFRASAESARSMFELSLGSSVDQELSFAGGRLVTGNAERFDTDNWRLIGWLSAFVWTKDGVGIHGSAGERTQGWLVDVLEMLNPVVQSSEAYLRPDSSQVAFSTPSAAILTLDNGTVVSLIPRAAEIAPVQPTDTGTRLRVGEAFKSDDGATVHVFTEKLTASVWDRSQSVSRVEDFVQSLTALDWNAPNS